MPKKQKVRDQRVISIYAGEETHKIFKKAAEKEHRSVGNMVLVMACRYMEQVDPETFKALEAAAHALKSYAYGNAAPDLAKEAGTAIQTALDRLKGGPSAPLR